MGHVISKNHVGREAELEQLRGAFTNARKGCGSLVVVRGEKGIGKTTLLHRFAAEAAQNGATDHNIHLNFFSKYRLETSSLKLLDSTQ